MRVHAAAVAGEERVERHNKGRLEYTISARSRRPAVVRRKSGRTRLVVALGFFQSDWSFSSLDDASLFGLGRHYGFLCTQVGRGAPCAILIGAARDPPRLSRAVRADATVPAGVATIAAAVGATRPRLRRLGNQVEPRASRADYGARRRVGTRCERRKREREREKGRKSTRRRPYLEKEISEEHFAPRTAKLLLLTPPPFIPAHNDDTTTATTTTLSSRSRSSASVRSQHRELFPQPVVWMDLTDEK